MLSLCQPRRHERLVGLVLGQRHVEEGELFIIESLRGMHPLPLGCVRCALRWCSRRGAGRKTGRADHSDKRRSRTLSASDGFADRPLVSRW